MPDTCENFLSRRNFLGLTAAATVTTALSSTVLGLLQPGFAYAVTSAEKQAEADEVKRRLDDYYATLDYLSNVYYEAMDAHDKAVELMGEAQARIDAALDRQNYLQEQLNQRARSMYKNGPLSFLDVIFGAHSFNEFITSWDLLNSINSRDAQLIQECKDARELAEAAYEEYAVQEAIANQKLADAEEAARQAQVIVDACEAELAQLEAEVAALLFS